ncbi:hypothetical protein [Chromobacterium violaceum]|uniref:CV39L family lectin n=1 Tax=Chromobacterium violaceum TaxID=536 RepID=UPI0005D3025E|nr:hypothetical protein [Chromobacterium violaceum]KJH67978.1 hypothetical protein UF16_07340 [Chromobacterium violaceum]
MSSQFHGLAIGNGNSNYLQVLGLANITDTAYLTDWQDSGGNWHAGFALPVPSDYPKGHFFQLTTGVGNSNYLQVLGAGEDGNPYLVSWQDGSGKWHGGMPLPKPSGYSGGPLVTGIGNSNYLQVIGARVESSPYLVAWQDNGGNWHAGMPLPNPSGYAGGFQQLATGNGNDHFLQVVGVGNDGNAYLVTWQNAQGQWSPGFALPKPSGYSGTFTQLATGVGNGNFLQVLGIGTDGNAYLAAWQDNGGNWHPGFALPKPSGYNGTFAKLVTGIGNSNYLQVFGIGSNGVAYLVSWQDSGGNWHGGLTLPQPSGYNGSFSQLAAGNGNSHYLQVVGTDAQGNVYLVSWQDSEGKWHAGFELPRAS